MLKKFYLTAIIGFIALNTVVLSGCGVDSTGPSAPQHQASRTENGLQITVSTAQASYKFGRDISFTGTVTNVSSAPIELDFQRGRPARYPNLSINVDNEDEFAVFVDGEGEHETMTLAPGKSFSHSYTWNQNHRITRDPVERGVFEAVVFCGLEDWTLRSAPLHIELN